MHKCTHYLITVCLFLFLSACDKEPQDLSSAEQAFEVPMSAQKTTLKAKGNFKTTEWIELLPADDLEALLNPPDYISNIEEGSLEDQAMEQLSNNKPLNAEASRYEQALASQRVIPEMDGQDIRIPGFIVPLEFGGEHIITEFFLVPFFGACVHLPPPPPNQIIHVRFPKGFKLETLYQPFWISGKLKIELIENDMATAAYTMVMQGYDLYTEEDDERAGAPPE